ncbi:MAG: phage holin family protein [Tepidisphaeraceae bacterium]
MEPLARLLVSFLELAETELALLKRGVIKLGLSLVFIAGAGVFGILGVFWVLYACFLWLEKLVGTPGAYLISGVLFLTAAATLGVLAFRGKPAAKRVSDMPAPTTTSDILTSDQTTPKVSPEGTDPHDPADLRIAS